MGAGEQVNEAVTGLPAPPLRPFVDYYSGYRQAGVAPAMHRGLPSPYLTLIFTLHEPLVIAAHPDPRQPAASYVTLAGGLHTTPALVTHEGWQSGIQLALSPLGARAILGLPAAELAIIDVDGSDVLGRLAGEVTERICAAATWPERFAVLDEVLSERLLRCERVVRPEVSYCWQRLLGSGGVVPVSALAAETGWSDRHLRSAFAAEIGLTPKAAARVIRFHRARRILQRRAVAGGALDIAGVAAVCGYYDQAHLDLEFRSLGGAPPTIWVAEEFRNFQAFDDGPGEGLGT
jgi:AraC-like DNA-binding protein